MVLDDNEIILREIFPAKKFFLNTAEKLRILFSFFYLAISIILIINLQAMLFIFAVFIFFVTLYLAFFRWILRYFDIRDNYYLVTNYRIIIAEKSTKEITKYKKLEEIKEINVQMNSSFFGNIIFGQPEDIFGKADDSFSFFKTNGMNFTEDKYIFLSVENIHEIVPVFESLGLPINKTFF